MTPCFAQDILTLGKGPWKVEVDLMQPLDPSKSPKVHVPPLNHIGLWVDDIHAVSQPATAQRDRPLSIGLTAWLWSPVVPLLRQLRANSNRP